MKINLSKLLTGKVDTIQLDFQYVLNNISELSKYDIIKTNPFHFSGKVYKNSDKIIITLNFEGEVNFRCSRCITSFKKPIFGAFESQILTRKDKDIEENYDGLYLEGDILDLTKSIEEAITLSLPMKVICNEECKGLCPDCGINLNSNNCNCSKEKIDPRLEKLKNFFETE